MKGTAGQLRKALEHIPDDVYVVFPDGTDNLPGLGYWDGDGTFSVGTWEKTGEPPRPHIRRIRPDGSLAAPVFSPERYIKRPYQPGDTVIELSTGEQYDPPKQEPRHDYSASRFR